jgi:malate dehydrogenase (oxaloacetate-decarboxylating)(NADP+)
MVAESTRVTEEMFAVAARTLASMVSEDDLAMGRVYPALSRIRDVSKAIAVEVAAIAYARGLARAPKPESLDDAVQAAMYQPVYPMYT